ncbi:MAG: NADH-quinone oxidoreductase subunit L [bacterium]
MNVLQLLTICGLGIPWVVVLVLAGGYSFFSKRKNVAVGLSIGFSVVLAFVALAMLGVFIAIKPEPELLSVPWMRFGELAVSLGIFLDAKALSVFVGVALVAVAIQLFSAWYMGHDGGKARFYVLVNLFVAAMLGLVVSPNFLQLFVFWELMGVCSFFLIGFWYEDPNPVVASKKAFLTTRFGDVGLLLGMTGVLSVLGTLDFHEIGLKLVASGEEVGTGILLTPATASILLVSVLLIFLGIMGKSAQFPLHIWLPDAMAGPTPASALIHAATMVASGVYLLVRCIPLFSYFPIASEVAMWIGALTVLTGAWLALFQTDIKKVLAYSTISQLGYMVVAAAAGAGEAALFHLLTHAFFKALLFLAAGAIIHSIHSQNMYEMGGLWKKMKPVAGAFLVGSASLMGIPPFSGFWSKDEILSVIWQNGDRPLFFFLLFGAFLTATYATKQALLVFSGSYRGKEKPHAVPKFAWGALWYLGILSIGLGLLGTPFANVLGKFLAGHGEHHESELNVLVMGGSLLIVSLGMIAGFFWNKTNFFAPSSRWHLAWISSPFFKYFSATQPGNITINGVAALFAKVNLAVVAWLALFDRYVVDAVVVGVGKGNLLLGRVSDVFDHQIIDRIVLGFAGMVRNVGNSNRRIQTGHIQEYLGFFLLGAVAVVVLIFFLR